MSASSDPTREALEIAQALVDILGDMRRGMRALKYRDKRYPYARYERSVNIREVAGYVATVCREINAGRQISIAQLTQGRDLLYKARWHRVLTKQPRPASTPSPPGTPASR